MNTDHQPATSSIADALKELLEKNQGPNYDAIVNEHKDLIRQLIKADVAVPTISSTIKRTDKNLNARLLSDAIKKAFPDKK